MSDLATLLGQAPRGFRGDPRYAPPARPAPPDPGDTLAAAFEEGFAAGLAEGQARAEAQAQADDAARDGLALSFARLDARLEEELRQRLHAAVSALCEGALAPLALDEEALAQRVTKAVSMLARADDERVIRLHPEDIALVSPRLPGDWRVEPDPALERGALRVETATGGVEDGPAQWRRAIAEALGQC
jgi:flagellar assembly protein FliH